MVSREVLQGSVEPHPTRDEVGPYVLPVYYFTETMLQDPIGCKIEPNANKREQTHATIIGLLSAFVNR